MQITKVKLIKGGDNGIEISTVKLEANKSTTKANEEHSAAVHVDFKAAMTSLAIHFGLLSDYLKPSQVKNIDKYDVELIKDFTVTGFSIKGDAEDKGFVLTGYKKKSNGKTITVNTPFTRFVEAEGSEYQFIEHLEARINEAEREVKEYLGGKVAPDPQGSLFSDEPEQGGETGAVVVTMNPDEHDSGDHIQTVPAGSKAAKPKPKKASSKPKSE